MFKKLTLSILFAACLTIAMAQTIVDTIPPYKKDNHLPAFKITLVNNMVFTNEQLPKNTYTVIVYFSPDCAHCKHEAKEIIKNIDQLKNVTFVWASYKPMAEIKAFYDMYEMQKYPNMLMGRDPQYQIPAFFRVKFTPFVAIYDKKGLFVNAFDGGVEMPVLLPILKQK